MKTQPKPTTTSKSAESSEPQNPQTEEGLKKLTPKAGVEKRNVYCVCCERPLNPKRMPIHHEGREKKKVPMCAKCHWALHYGSLEVREQMKKKMRAWLKKQQK